MNKYWHFLYKTTFLFFTHFSVTSSVAQINYDATKGEFILQNKTVRRVIKAHPDRAGFYTTSFFNRATGKEYGQPLNSAAQGVDEFRFSVNGTPVSGNGKDGHFRYANHTITTDGARQRLTAILTGNGAAAGIEVSVIYELYDTLPVVRKWLSITNRRAADVRIENLSWERLHLKPVSFFPSFLEECEIYGTYAQQLKYPPFTGTAEDPAVLVYNPKEKQGFLVGNESPGVLKQTEVYTLSAPTISIGLSDNKTDFSFRSNLSPNETFESPKGFVMLVSAPRWQYALEGGYKQFLRKYLDIKTFTAEQKPLFMYNTWEPFWTKISDTMIYPIINAAAQSGADYFCIDDGWQNDRGSWDPHPTKFPQGLKPVFDSIRAKGMKPGLWFALLDVSRNSPVFEQFAAYTIKGKDGTATNIHWPGSKDYTISVSSPYYDYIKNKISGYVKELQLAYIKVDISAFKSAYVYDPAVAGDYEAKEDYKDRQESYLALIRKIGNLFTELKKEHPSLYIDCTFELWGYPHIIDYNLLQYADGDWISNFRNPLPESLLNVRQLCYDRARLIPASSMIIGNMEMQRVDKKLAFHSLFSATPIMLGDPRKLSVAERKWFNETAAFFKGLEKKYNITDFYQAYDVFSRPVMSGWDGCYRFNEEKGGGLLCFYRNDSPESSRTFPVPCVDAAKRYMLYSGVTKKGLGVFTGKQLQNGLRVTIPSRFAAELVAIEEVK